MKKFLYLFLLGLLVISYQSCTEDPIDNTPVAPTVGFVATSGYITADAIVDGGSEVKTKISATKGNSNLKALYVYSKKATDATATLVDVSILKINGAPANANPTLILVPGDQSAFTYDVAFTTPATAEEVTYTFEVTDNNNEKSSVKFVITTKDVRLKLITAAKLYNKQGPAGKGGLDLHTGTSTGSTDATAELIDLGNNADLTYKGGFTARTTETVIKATVETWDALNSEAAIEAAFNAGNNVGVNITAIKGNVYVIKSGIFYFAIKINSITDDPSTTTFANDFIDMDIKQKN